MSVYIKGMEMPMRCGRCDFRIPVFDDGMFDHYECCITAAIIDNLGEKMEDCPLVPVPKHGRLIDADALAEELSKRVWYKREDEKQAVRIVKEFPTVDAVPVVRCRECMMRQYCKVAQYLGADGFCSNGEKRG